MSLTNLPQDLRFAARLLIKDRSFTRANEPHYDQSVMRVMDDSAKDKAAHKLWCIANNIKA